MKIWTIIGLAVAAMLGWVGYWYVAATAKETLDIAEAAGDDVTVDMMVERITIHDKTAWMLRSTLG